MSEVQPNTPPATNPSTDSVDKLDDKPATVDPTISDDEPAASSTSQKDVAAVNTVVEEPRPSSVSDAANVLSHVPLQGLEEAARQFVAQKASQAANVQARPPPQQVQPAPGAQNVRPLAPAPARVNLQQIQPAPPQAFVAPPPPVQPQVFYPHQPGTPLLMNQCPRCGLRAGEPFQPMHYPNNGAYPPPYAPEFQRFPPPPLPIPKKPNASKRGPVQPQTQWQPPPQDHPNRHMWIPPPGYQAPPPQNPAPQVPNPGASAYSAIPVPQEAPTYPPRKNPQRREVLPPRHTSSRLPSPPPARRPLTLVDADTPEESANTTTYAANGRPRKSSKPYRRRMSRDERRDILLMRKLGYKMEQIARYLGTTVSAVNYTIRQGDPEPKHKNAGRKVKIPEEKIEAMLVYVKDYMEREKACPVDKRTGRKTMKHLSYNMIRQAVFADETGEIPAKFKFTDDALKTTLNKRGIWLRAPMSAQMVEVARARGKKMWAEKLERDKKAAEAAAAAGTVVEEGQGASEGYVDAGELEELDEQDASPDEDMEDASGEDDAISIPSDAEDGQDAENSDQDSRDLEPERGDFRAGFPQPITSFNDQAANMGLLHGHSVIPR